jgi:hypothetical protein
MLRTFIVMAALAASTHSLAQPVAAPLELELGKSTCTEAARKLGVAPTGESVWAGGAVLPIPVNNPAVGLEGLVGGIVVCNQDDKIIFINLRFPKGGLGMEGVTATARHLDSKYRRGQRNLPVVGNGFAEWKSANGTIELNYVHLSFEFDVDYWTPGAKALHARWQAGERQRREEKKAGKL